MFRALCAHHQVVKIVLYSIWYHLNEDITKCLDTYCNTYLYVRTTVLLHKVICKLHVSTNK